MLMPALTAIDAAARSPRQLVKFLLAGCAPGPGKPGTAAALQRLNLQAPRRISDRVQALLLRGALNLVGSRN